ncbi:hypothetical protein MPTK1_3g16390 [Marchantia polymorpha subsp. ruderalis]|uniref:Uncharacterized protein n=2 Tax=Marchantia polymorpha TaxID=3197 RepID=A0AAF6B1G0_MARPO|nr:hypothetical protein MARPO_0004s0032 [Marchantia polymorpha]BBN05844.1 hypothetical protein Mp_3g16390 [Marchantia polymorpha subsp. ruderalis]|eukprot:PTQ48733.1 hypothetical protein MARPO_0004s0032 [Marchantia polymorpha]
MSKGKANPDYLHLKNIILDCSSSLGWFARSSIVTPPSTRKQSCPLIYNVEFVDANIVIFSKSTQSWDLGYHCRKHCRATSSIHCLRPSIT